MKQFAFWYGFFRCGNKPEWKHSSIRATIKALGVTLGYRAYLSRDRWFNGRMV